MIVKIESVIMKTLNLSIGSPPKSLCVKFEPAIRSGSLSKFFLYSSDRGVL